MNSRITIFCIFITIFNTILQAQPNWKITPSNFEYTMSLTAVGIIPCSETNDPKDILAAFSGNELRGVCFFDGEANGRNYAYMVVYDTLLSGNKITFKVYDASKDSIYDALNSFTFNENGIIGNVENPYIIKSFPRLKQIQFSKNSLVRPSPIDTEISELFLLNENNDTIQGVFELINDSNFPDNQFVKISDNKLILKKDLLILSKDYLMIHIRGNSTNNCSLDTAFRISLISPNYTNNNSKVDKLITIHPNPTNSNFNLQLDQEHTNLTIKLYNSTGILIETIDITKPSQQINFGEDYPSGIYYLHSIINSNKYRIKLIKNVD